MRKCFSIALCIWMSLLLACDDDAVDVQNAQSMADDAESVVRGGLEASAGAMDVDESVEAGSQHSGGAMGGVPEAEAPDEIPDAFDPAVGDDGSAEFTPLIGGAEGGSAIGGDEDADLGIGLGGAMASCIFDADCPEWNRCHSEVCQYDLRNPPTDPLRLFRLTDVRIFQPPSPCDELLENIIMNLIDTGEFSLMVEPGQYVERDDGPDPYRWYAGPGQPSAGRYNYMSRFPIQNLFGHWEYSGERPSVWHYEATEPLSMYLPTGRRTRTAEDGTTSRVDCYGRLGLPITEMRIEPRLPPLPMPMGGMESPPSTVGQNEEISLFMMVRGYLTVANAQAIAFDLGNGDLPLSEILSICAKVDRDGDGVEDSYPFHLEGTATEVLPSAGLSAPYPSGSNRDPDRVWTNPLECDL